MSAKSRKYGFFDKILPGKDNRGNASELRLTQRLYKDRDRLRETIGAIPPHIQGRLIPVWNLAGLIDEGRFLRLHKTLTMEVASALTLSSTIPERPARASAAVIAQILLLDSKEAVTWIRARITKFDPPLAKVIKNTIRAMGRLPTPVSWDTVLWLTGYIIRELRQAFLKSEMFVTKVDPPMKRWIMDRFSVCIFETFLHNRVIYPDGTNAKPKDTKAHSNGKGHKEVKQRLPTPNPAIRNRATWDKILTAAQAAHRLKIIHLDKKDDVHPNLQGYAQNLLHHRTKTGKNPGDAKEIKKLVQDELEGWGAPAVRLFTTMIMLDSDGKGGPARF